MSTTHSDPETPPADDASRTSPPEQALSLKQRTGLALGALGVVYGDIGTSPLYALRESLAHVGGGRAHVLGVISLIFWSLVTVIVGKYLTFILRADHHGEGGVLALLTLARRKGRSVSARHGALLYFALAGAALLLADGMITPAISVLSAVEGLAVATPKLEPFLIPIAIAILVGLFRVQRRGTGHIGAWFGPAVLVWFASITALGMPWIVRQPDILLAVDPRYGLHLLTESPQGFTVLGSVVLCVTGGEALYADLGHFGRKPIRLAWYAVVFPALLASYFGQGAYVLSHPHQARQNLFFEMAPPALLIPLVLVATCATVVAAQALISGVYSLTQQAIQLGYLPRLTIVHTSKEMQGRIYVPHVNTMLMVTCIGLVLGFRSSSALAAAYGVAVTGTMVVTSLLFYFAMRRRWGLWRAGLLVAAFLVIDLAFLSANLVKLAHGGWFPLLVGAALVATMTSWRSGTEAVGRHHGSLLQPLSDFFTFLKREQIVRVPGAAVFLARDERGTPPTLVHYVKHAHALHQTVILLTIQTERVPRVAFTSRVEHQALGNGFFRVTAHYGFMETPRVQPILEECKQLGLLSRDDAEEFTVFVGHSSVQPTGASKMASWRKRLFAFLNRNAQPAALYYGVRPEQVVEIGVRLDI